MTDQSYLSDACDELTEAELQQSYTAKDADIGCRLDLFLSQHADMTRSQAARLIEDGKVLVGESICPKRYALRAGDTVTVTLPAPTPTAAIPEELPLHIVYEDADLLVINKPAGLVVHPAPGHPTGTLVNALLHHCKGELSGIGGVLRPGIVHRIDKDTGGLLVVAKHDKAHRALSAQLEGHHIEREYHALVRGGFRESCGTIDAPIGRHPTDRKRMAVIRDATRAARPAVTHYTLLEAFGQISYVECRLETGRTHQIRVHMSYTGHPLLGDTVYGGGTLPFEKRHAALLHGQALFARRLSFTHPTTGEPVSFEAPLPDDMQELLRLLRAERDR